MQRGFIFASCVSAVVALGTGAHAAQPRKARKVTSARVTPPPAAPKIAPVPPPPPAVPTAAVSVPPATEPDHVTPPFDAMARRRVAITLNPLALAVSRYGANIELLVAGHHAIGASAYVQSFPAWMLRTVLPDAVTIGSGPPSLVGGEIGYRFYTSSESASGFFVGPSLVAMPLAYPRVNADGTTDVVSFHAFGGAADLGAQAVLGSGFTIGGGVGVMALAYSPPESASPPPGVATRSFPEPHLLPRLLLSAGWSF